MIAGNSINTSYLPLDHQQAEVSGMQILPQGAKMLALSSDCIHPGGQATIQNNYCNPRNIG